MARKKREVKIATNPDLMPKEEFANELGVKTQTTDVWAREGRGPKRIQIGNRAYYHRPSVQQYVAELFGQS